MAVKTKKAQPTAAQSSFLPPENIWSALRAAKEKTAQRAANSDFSPFLVRFYNLARTYFEEKCWKLQAPPPSTRKRVLRPAQKTLCIFFEISPAEIF